MGGKELWRGRKEYEWTVGAQLIPEVVSVSEGHSETDDEQHQELAQHCVLERIQRVSMDRFTGQPYVQLQNYCAGSGTLSSQDKPQNQYTNQNIHSSYNSRIMSWKCICGAFTHSLPYATTSTETCLVSEILFFMTFLFTNAMSPSLSQSFSWVTWHSVRPTLRQQTSHNGRKKKKNMGYMFYRQKDNPNQTSLV